MLARALARATNFERDMLTHCDRHVVSVVTLGCDKSQARFAGRGMIVGSDGNDGDLLPELTNIKTIRQQRCLEVASRPAMF
jgi:hypothetical protein